MIERKIALNVVAVCLREMMEETGHTAEISEETVIVGKDAVLDSVEVVALIVNIEQRLEMEHDVSVTLASDKAMSQRSSPFRTVGVLADHVIAVLSEGVAA